MPLIKVIAEKLETGEQREFWLDNLTGNIHDSPDVEVEPTPEPFGVSASTPVGKGNITRLKIQMGLACNYSCSYCSQSAFAHPKAKQSRDITATVEKVRNAIPDDSLNRIEFWGGEPLVYWKTLKPLAEALRVYYPSARFSIITNGSLVTKEIADWLDENGFVVSISHDGPGQHARGEDPLDTNYEAIDYLIGKLLPSGRFSFNSMLHRDSHSRLAIMKFFDERFPQHNFPSFGEMFYVDPYNEGGHKAIGFTEEEHYDIRRMNWLEMKYNLDAINRASSVGMALDAYMNDRTVAGVGQKCGMDDPEVLAMDMDGNVLTCQNVAHGSIAPNGKMHTIGKIDKMEDIKLRSATHWSRRDNCPTCPVLKSCKGSCMFLQGKGFDSACDIMFSSHVAVLAAAFEVKTGFIPVRFEAEWLPANRQSIWG